MIERRITGVGNFVDGLTDDLVLSGNHVLLRPMSSEDVSGLINAASHGDLWNLAYTGVPSPQTMQTTVSEALRLRDKGEQFPFTVRLASTGEIVGSTRYYYISPEHRNLSIGFTWYGEHVHRTGVNTECKYLLLKHAFETLNCISVQWHTDHRNKRSQNAILRLGAKFEGVLRNARIMPDGVIRHTHCFSMLDTEWPKSKGFLASRLAYYS